MRVTIARKAAFLLLLFNFGGLGCLALVSWVFGQYSPDHDFQNATLKQRELATQIYEEIRSYPHHRPEQFSAAVQKLDQAIAETERKLLQIHLSSASGLPKAHKTLGEAKRVWNEMKPPLQHLADQDGTSEELRNWLSEVEARMPELMGVCGRLIGDAFVIQNRVRRERIIATVLGVCVLNVVLFLVGMCLSHLYLARPVRLIKEGALALRAGNLKYRIPVVTRDELATLTETFNDMSASIAQLLAERDRAEAALRASESSYRLLFENNPQSMWVYDQQTLAFLAVNDTAVRQYGYSREEFLSMTIAQIRASEDVSPLLDMISTYAEQGSFFGAARHTRKDGSTIEVEVSAHKLNFGSRPASLVIAHDITEKKTFERELLHSQKLEAIGRLSGGVAHDFNNLLTIISGYGDLLLQETPRDHASYAKVQGIKKASRRAAALTRHLLAFSRKQVLQPKVVDLNHIIRSNCEIWSRLFGADIAMNTILYPEVWPVRLDPMQFEQVLINLCINARDAMPGRGQLTIQTANVNVGDRKSFRDGSSVQGPWVVISIADTGCGMDEQTMSKIFEPFFTTKPAGKGTGLGLSTVYGIVKQSGGHISVESELGRGTTFEVYFPALVDVALDAEPVPFNKSIGNGSEVVLLAEDDITVRELARGALEESGYTVLEAANGWEGLRIAEEHMGQIDLLLTDIVMPGMNGKELSYEIRRLRPEIKVLFISGYTDEVLDQVSLLHKPFPMEELKFKVRQVLDEATA